MLTLGHSCLILLERWEGPMKRVNCPMATCGGKVEFDPGTPVAGMIAPTSNESTCSKCGGQFLVELEPVLRVSKRARGASGGKFEEVGEIRFRTTDWPEGVLDG